MLSIFILLPHKATKRLVYAYTEKLPESVPGMMNPFEKEEIETLQEVIFQQNHFLDKLGIVLEVSGMEDYFFSLVTLQ